MKTFLQFLENSVIQIPITSLIMTKSELKEAVGNIARGHPAITEGPIEVAMFPKDYYQLVNGYHRMVEIMLRGENTISVKVTQNATWKISRSDRFKFEPDKPYKGLERFIEIHLLKKL